MTCSADFKRSPRRLFLEWHSEASDSPSWETVMEVVSALRPHARRRGCPVLLLTVLRHPAEFYASFWKYHLSPALLAAPGGGSLEGWVGTHPNLQASILVAGVSHMGSQPLRRRYFGNPTGDAARTEAAFHGVRDTAVLHTLLGDFDIVGAPCPAPPCPARSPLRAAQRPPSAWTSCCSCSLGCWAVRGAPPALSFTRIGSSFVVCLGSYRAPPRPAAPHLPAPQSPPWA